MVINLRVVLMLIGIVLFLLAAIGVSTWKVDRLALVAGGLALWLLALLVG